LPGDPESSPTFDPANPDQPDKGSRGPKSPEKRIGPYEILGEIGRGGMGIVYKAFHPALKRTVALKVLIAGEDASEEAIARFHREAEAVAKLGHHPHIVPVHDIGVEGKVHYFAMHFVEGVSLDKMIDGGEITPEHAAIITKKLSEALAHAHSHGILHRDIKPANVLMGIQELPRASEIPNPKSQIPNLNDTGSGRLDRAGGASGESGSEPMLTDFGLAKDVESESKMTRSGMTLGTPQYMPPEQADGRLEEIDERSDVYGLGATLYEMLAMRPPFEGSAVIEVIQKVLLKDPLSPRRHRPSVSRDLETICLKCLEKEPGKRYGSAQELARDLDRTLKGRPIVARPISRAERIWRRVRRNRALAGALAGAFLLLVAGGIGTGIGIHQWRKEKTEKDREASARKEAEEKETESQELLRKGQQAAQVLLGANMKLGHILHDIKKSYHNIRRTPEDRRRVYDTHREEIEEFGRSVSKEKASQATFLAVKGWFLIHGGYEREAIDTFRESRHLDSEVPWGFIFDAMFWVSLYLDGIQMPAMHVGPGGMEFDPVPGETRTSRIARTNFQNILKWMPEKSIWDPARTEDFKKFFDGLSLLAKGDPESVERGLTAGLRIPEVAWIETELLFARARMRYMLGRFDEGLKDLERVVGRFPEWPAVHTYRGHLLLGRAIQGLLKKEDAREILKTAIAAQDEALRLDPELCDPLEHKGTAHFYIGEVEQTKREDPRDSYRSAIRCFSEVLKKKPDRASTHHLRGVAYLELAEQQKKRGENPLATFQSAIRDFSQALKASEVPERILMLRGRAQILSGRELMAFPEKGRPFLESGVEDCTQALQLSPDLSSIYKERAFAYIFLGQIHLRENKEPWQFFRKGIDDYHAFLDRSPRDAHVLTLRAYAYLVRGEARVAFRQDPLTDYRRSLDDLSAAIEIDPGNIMAWKYRGGAYRYLGQAISRLGRDSRPMYRKAVEAYDEALRLQPDDANEICNRGIAFALLSHAQKRRGEEHEESRQRGEADFRRALELRPNYGSAYFNLGTLLEEKGDEKAARGGNPRPLYEEALKEYGESLKFSPFHWRTYLNRGGVLEKLKRFDEAIHDYEKAIKIGGQRLPLIEQRIARAKSALKDSKKDE
jgi:serine/threonine protein kinase/tetratricopeptide (TPR) repeat protein